MVGQDGTSTYGYDTTSQLTSATHTYQSNETYSYDANGNRTMTGYQTGTDNRLTNDGTYTYTYLCIRQVSSAKNVEELCGIAC